jgi:hypothetical protein
MIFGDVNSLNEEDKKLTVQYLKLRKQSFNLTCVVFGFILIGSPFFRPCSGGDALIVEMSYISAIMYFFPFLLIPWYYFGIIQYGKSKLT